MQRPFGAKRSMTTFAGLMLVLATTTSCTGATDMLAELRGNSDNAAATYAPPTGEVAIEPTFQFVRNFSEGLASACTAVDPSSPMLGYECGYIDREGKWVIEPQFDEAHDFSGGLARVAVSGEGETWASKFGFVDKSGQFVIPIKFKSALDFADGLAMAWNEEDYADGYIDVTGAWKLRLEPGIRAVGNFHDGLALAQLESYVKYDKDGIGQFIEQDQKFGFIDKSGKWSIAPKWDIAHRFSEGLAMVGVFDANRNIAKLGYLDTAGKFQIKLTNKFTNGLEFSEGLAAVTTGTFGDGPWQFIDRNGKLVPNLKFVALAVPSDSNVETVYGFRGGLVGATRGFEIDGGMRLYNLEGQPEFPQRFYEVGAYHEGLVKYAESKEMVGMQVPVWGFLK